MANKVDGEIYEKITSSFEWKIPIHNSDLFKLCFWGYSSKFSFCDTNWDARISRESDDEMSLRLLKLSCFDTEQRVTLKWSMQAADGTEAHSGEEQFEFCKSKSSMGVPLFHGRLPDVVAGDFLTISFTITCYRCAGLKNTLPKAEGECSTETETQDQGKSAKRGTKDFEKLSRNFKDLLVTGQDSDVTVKVNDREFPVHKLILGARSSVFERMFRHDMIEKKEGIVDIRDCTPDAFQEFLLYLYSGELEEFSRDTVFDLYVLSDKYDVEELKSSSLGFIAEDLSTDTLCDVVRLALQHKEAALLEKATTFFSENLKKIIVSIKWQSFIQENPIEANELYIKALTDVCTE